MSLVPFLLLLPGVACVAVTEVRLLSDSSHHQYVLHGEGATLSCHYIVENDEVVHTITWDKDGEQVYSWKHGGSPIARGVLDKKVDSTMSTPTIIVIPKAHIDMQGTFTCKVATNLKTEQNEIYVTVINDACQEKSWSTHSDRVACKETLKLECVGMFPKPSPACGLYNELTGTYLTSVPFERIQKLPNNTYDISLTARFQAKDWLNFTDISFRCYILVMGTSWRRGISHRLFGDPGCPSPSVIPSTSYNVTAELSCWGRPREGSKLSYQCDGNLKMNGPSNYYCRSGKWLADGKNGPTTCSGISRTIQIQKLLLIVLVLLVTSK